jgi:hypothetical protein
MKKQEFIALVEKILSEADIMDRKIKNPETGNLIKISTALSYGNDTSVHKAAKAIMDKQPKHKYKLGDEYQYDFDDEGMIKMATKVNTDWSIKDLDLLHNSLIDMNYHPAGRQLTKVIDLLKKGDKETANKELEAFKKALNENNNIKQEKHMKKSELIQMVERITKKVIREMDDSHDNESTEKVISPEAKAEIIDFFKTNPNPDDGKVHDLAAKLNIEPDDVEEFIYTLATKQVNEASYSDFVKQEEDSPKKKVNKAIAEINSNLIRIERLAKHASRLKSEANISSDTYWNATKQRIGKIQERITKLNHTMKNLGA